MFIFTFVEQNTACSYCFHSFMPCAMCFQCGNLQLDFWFTDIYQQLIFCSFSTHHKILWSQLKVKMITSGMASGAVVREPPGIPTFPTRMPLVLKQASCTSRGALGEGSSTWVSASHLGDQDSVLGSRIWPGPALASTDIWRANQRTGNLSLQWGENKETFRKYHKYANTQWLG